AAAGSGEEALAMLRGGAGVDLVMIDVAMDIAALIHALQAERIAVPVIACGIDAPAERAVAAIRAGARDYLPLPAERALIAAAIASIGKPVKVDWLVGHTVEEVERELILQTLERCHGNRTSASHILGISVRTMRNKLRTFIEAGIPVSPAI
ncbi:MAG: helix-turn-helix domain-containing protein, partial [Sphingomonas bacterium]